MTHGRRWEVPRRTITQKGLQGLLGYGDVILKNMVMKGFEEKHLSKTGKR